MPSSTAFHSFVDYVGYSISSKELLPTIVDMSEGIDDLKISCFDQRRLFYKVTKNTKKHFNFINILNNMALHNFYHFTLSVLLTEIHIYLLLDVFDTPIILKST